MDSKNLFSERDREILESLIYNPDLEPSYEGLKSCLIWADEQPRGLSSEGYETVCNLWIARAHLYHGLELPEPLEPQFYIDIWNKAVADEIKWPGFNRLSLSDKDKAYYLEKLNSEDPF